MDNYTSECFVTVSGFNTYSIELVKVWHFHLAVGPQRLLGVFGLADGQLCLHDLKLNACLLSPNSQNDDTKKSKQCK